MRKDFYLQGKDLEREMHGGSGRVRFEWNLLYECNYRCPYCFFEGKWEEYGKRTVYFDVKEWMKYWKRIYDKFGRVSVVVTGGEPFIYPDFIGLIKALTEIHYPINISTNSSGDLMEFVENIDPDKVSLTFAFHPGFNTLDEVIERMKFVKDRNFSSDYINFCAYPALLKNLDEYIEKARLVGEKLKVIPFCGIYGNVNYPQGYSKEEKEKMGMDTKWENNIMKKGKLCAAGYKSALLFPDGKVARCGQVGERLVIGNFFADDFSLLDRPLPCDAEQCPCLEAVPVED